MKVFYHSALAHVELNRDSVFYTVPCKARLEIEKEKGDQEYDIIFNGAILDSNQMAIEMYANAELIIRQHGEKSRYVVKAIARPLTSDYARVYEQFMFEYREKKDNEIEAISTGNLKLYAVDQSTEIQDYTEIFDKIDAAFSAFKSICEKPKSHLRSVNEVRPIETVKRIGHESIPYLAAHSEDWLARTASGLKPARLFSRVEDDEYQIYENRVVKTLIDLIIAYLRKTEKKLKDQYGQLEITINSGVQMGSFGFDVSFQKAVFELMSSDSKGDAHRNKAFALAKKLHARAHALLKRYRTLRQTRLYRYLKKAKPVTNPLNETNILLMDKHYNVVFKLWKSLHKVLAPKEVDDENGLDFKYTYEDYLLFCKSLCGYTAHVLNFDIIEDGHYYRESDNLDWTIRSENDLIHVTICDKTRRYLKIPSGLQVPILPGTEHNKFSFDGSCLMWDNDTTDDEIDKFCALFKTQASRGKEQAEEKKRYSSLKIALLDRQQEYSRPASCSLVIFPATVELDSDNRNSFREHVIAIGSTLAQDMDVAFTIIALPICSENEQKVITYAKHASEKVLILPLTMFDINSFRRLQNIFLRLILSLCTTRCPCCGELMREKDSQYICDNCNQLTITRTHCSNPECKHEFDYLSYEVSDDTIEKMRLVDQENFYQVDSLYQYKDIVDMAVVDHRVHAVCPYCGK